HDEDAVCGTKNNSPNLNAITLQNGASFLSQNLVTPHHSCVHVFIRRCHKNRQNIAIWGVVNPVFLDTFAIVTKIHNRGRLVLGAQSCIARYKWRVSQSSKAQGRSQEYQSNRVFHSSGPL